MVKNVLFDLDDTLFDFKRAERIALEKTLQRLGYPAEEKILQRYSLLNQAQWKLLEEGKLLRAEVKIRRFRLLFEEFSMP